MKKIEKLEGKRKLIKLLAKLAPRIGAMVKIEPEWGTAAQIIYSNGVVRSMLGYLLDLNNTASTGMSTDKEYAKFFMKERGYSVAEGKTIFENSWAKEMQSNRTISFAIKYAKHLCYPVIVKPNSKSQGWGVCLVSNKSELVLALREIFKEEKVAIVERYMPGKDYRIVVLDGEVISAYERLSLSVTGDGDKSIFLLLKEKQQSVAFMKRGIKINFKDRRIRTKLSKQGLTIKSVLPQGQRVFLLDIANLSPGGEAVDVMKNIHKNFCKIAVKLTEDMGLRFCGIDIMVTKGDISNDPKGNCDYYIIEINSSPGLISHYLKSYKEQEKIKEAIYLKILKALGKKDTD